jgi:lysophospholipase L1-like esterase
MFALLLPTSTPAQAPTRVACVGDSITYGYTLSDRKADTYPSVLQDLLGSDFKVGNFGDSGTTVQASGDQPWRAQVAHSQYLAFTPNIVVIMLGTNDAKPYNWSKARFVNDYHALIAEFRRLGAEVYVATPPAVIPPGAFDIQAAVVNDEVVPLVRQIAADANAPLIDVHAAFENQPSLLPDRVHPNAAGARLIAQRVADVLRADNATTLGAPTGTGAP